MTRHTTSYEPGDVVFVPFLFTDATAVKHRPALVISSARYNASRREIIIAAITSRVRRRTLVGDTRISDWKAGGLIKPSVVTAILWTARSGMVRQKLGSLSRRDLVAFRSALTDALL